LGWKEEVLRSVRIFYKLQNCLREITTTFLESTVTTSIKVAINAHAINVSIATTIRRDIVKTAFYLIILKTIAVIKSNGT